MLFGPGAVQPGDAADSKPATGIGRSRFWGLTSPRAFWRAPAAGEYLQIEVNRGMPAPLLVKYFQRAGLDWQIKDELRRVVRFAPFDLRQSMSGLGPFDLVLCRTS